MILLVGQPDIDTSVIVFSALTSIVVAVLVAVAKYRSWRYEVREDGLYVRRGLLRLQETYIPGEHIQKHATKRTAYDRLLDLSTVIVYTAGLRHSRLTLPGLSTSQADAVRRHLSRFTEDQE